MTTTSSTSLRILRIQGYSPSPETLTILQKVISTTAIHSLDIGRYRISCFNKHNKLKKRFSSQLHPPMHRDFSVVLPAQATLDDIQHLVEDTMEKKFIYNIAIIHETLYEKLHEDVVKRLKMKPNFKNVLFRVSFLSAYEPLTKEEVNHFEKIIQAVFKVNTDF